jgi:hypothetical protein
VGKTIFAYFRDSEEAEFAADQLKSIGVSDLKFDRLDQFTRDGVDQLSPTIGTPQVRPA